MRISAQAPRFLIIVLLVALLATLGGFGCGKKSDDQAKSGAGSMPGGPGGGGMPGAPGGMPGAPGGMPGAPGGMPGAPGGGGGMMAGGGATGGAPAAAPAAAPVSVDPQKSPSAPAVTPAPAPSAQQIAVVGEAVWTMRLMTSRNVPPPPPGKEPKPKPKPAAGSGGAMPGMGGGAPGGGMMPGMGGGAPGGGMMPGMGGGAPGGGMMPGAPGGAMPGPGMMGPKAARPFTAKDYRFAQGSPKGGPDGKGAKGMPADAKGGKGGPGGDAPAAVSSTPTPMAIAQALKTVCQKTRGIEMNGQQFYHEYWFMLSKSLLDEVVTKYSDFPVAQLSWAAQTKSDWEGYMWHWAVRKMLTQSSNSDLQDVAKYTAKARIALATVRAIAKHGMLMKGVNQTRMGKLLYPTMDHVANCVQFAFGNPNYDPASIQRDESKRSRLVVEVFDNYLKTGGNWRWYRSRDWAYLSRYSSTVPSYTCDACGTTLKPEQMKQLYRCPTCGKSMRPNIPGTWDTVEPYKTAAGRTDDYRVAGMRNPMDDRMPDGRYSIRKSWYSPTFQRQREAYRNAQHVHALVNMVMASNMPTRADFDAMKAWAASSPKPTRIPEIHQMELEVNEVRLRETARIR